MKHQIIALCIFLGSVFCFMQSTEAKVYSFQAGDYHYIYSDQNLTNVRLQRNGSLIWRGTLKSDQYIQVEVFFDDTVRLDATEWNGWWYRAPNVNSDAGYNWVIQSLENQRGALRQLKLNRKVHSDFPID